MGIRFTRANRLIAAAVLSISMAVGQVKACMVSVPPDADFWAEHATRIVDATAIAVERQPLTKPQSSEESDQGPTTWVLTLKVHRTLRSDPSDTRRVATRFSNTTTVDERFVRDILGDRKEFALVDFDAGTPSAFAADSQAFEFPPTDGILPPHDGFHVWDSHGEPLDEIWEGICITLPIFDLGTFGG